jgi:hypothetical protein
MLLVVLGVKPYTNGYTVIAREVEFHYCEERNCTYKRKYDGKYLDLIYIKKLIPQASLIRLCQQKTNSLNIAADVMFWKFRWTYTNILCKIKCYLTCCAYGRT